MKHRTKKILSYVVILAVIIVAGVGVTSKFVHFGNVEFTNNAQIQRQIVPVNSRVQGFIKEIRFKEFEPVKKGDTLVVLDDADMRLKVIQARADYQKAVVGRTVAERSVRGASENVNVSEASIAEAKILMENASVELSRYTRLFEKGAVTRQQFDHINTDYSTKKARYETLLRQLSASSSVATETKQRIFQNDAGVELANALLEIAELNLSYTVITAPCDGFASRKKIQIGQFVQLGHTLLDVVDAGDVWVTANFKETQIKHIHEGSEVEIKVDAIPGKTFYGKVVSLSSSTGDALSIIPQDNSAGNFVKVRQRIPVRIEFTDATDLTQFRAGMNVECKVKY